VTEIPNRVVGTEMEWPIAGVSNSGLLTRLPLGSERRIIQECVPEDLIRTGVMGITTNGGRIYEDQQFIEYATPEDNNLMSAVTNEIAGERIVNMMLEEAYRKRIIGNYILSKRVMDDLANTWGYHASFSVDNSFDIKDQNYMMPVGMHLATQNIYAGSGAIWHHQKKYNEGQAVYALAQKVCNLDIDYYHTSHFDGNRAIHNPLVSTKDESLSKDGSKRVHLTSMDANISPWASWMRLGTTSIVLRLIEDGYRGEDITLRDQYMYQFATDIAVDLNMKHSVKLTNGDSARALDIQRTFINRAKNIELSPDEALIMPEWERALDDLEINPDRLIDRADWVIRKRAIDNKMQKHDVDINSTVAAGADLAYDQINRPGGTGMALREKSVWSRWMPTEQQIENAMWNPPQTTRAKGRSELIRKYKDSLELSVTWDLVTPARSGERFLFSHPLQIEPTVVNGSPSRA
jgi:proteasome accessory factor A